MKKKREETLFSQRRCERIYRRFSWQKSMDEGLLEGPHGNERRPRARQVQNGKMRVMRPNIAAALTALTASAGRRSSHLFRQLQCGLLLPLRRSTFQKEMGDKWPFRPTGGRPFKFQKLAAISSERGSERGPPYSSTGNKVCNKSRGRKIFALQKARGARSVHRFEKYYFLPRRPDSQSRCLSSLFWWLDATEGNRLPLLVERKINFTEPLCLPCSLLCFISCPTLYGKRQPATKRARRALRERITFSVMDFLRDDDN